MLTDPKLILQEVIDQDGDCSDFACPAVCKRCPLGSKRIDGRRVNCMDYLNVDIELPEEVKRDIYKKAAEEELFTIELEEILSE